MRYAFNARGERGHVQRNWFNEIDVTGEYLVRVKYVFFFCVQSRSVVSDFNVHPSRCTAVTVNREELLSDEEARNYDSMSMLTQRLDYTARRIYAISQCETMMTITTYISTMEYQSICATIIPRSRMT